MKQALILLATMLCLTVAQAADKKDTRPSSEMPLKRAVSWTPEIYSEDATSLPRKYMGTNGKKMHALLKSSLTSLKKGEFETTSAFEARTADKEALIAPLNYKDLYAFSVELGYSKLKYDADTQEYLVAEGFTCGKPPIRGEREGWMNCRVETVWSKSDTYVGANVFGVSNEIKRFRGHDFSISIYKRQRGMNLDDLFSIGDSNRMYLIDRISVPIEKAVTLKGKNIRALIVGRLLEARLIEDVKYVWRPTISSPSDMLVTEDAVPFAVSKIVYYVYETGEILFERTK